MFLRFQADCNSRSYKKNFSEDAARCTGMVAAEAQSFAN
jgi:hypothetical protein